MYHIFQKVKTTSFLILQIVSGKHSKFVSVTMLCFSKSLIDNEDCDWISNFWKCLATNIYRPLIKKVLPSLIKINTYPPKSTFKREYPHGKEQLDLISPASSAHAPQQEKPLQWKAHVLQLESRPPLSN